MKWAQRSAVSLVFVVAAVGGGSAVLHATRRPSPSSPAAARIVEYRFGTGRTTCGPPRDYEQGQGDYWDYECTLGESTGSVLVRFNGDRIADSEIIV